MAIAALRAKRPETEAVTRFLAEAYVGGVGVDWGAVFAGYRPRRVGLPTYAFERQRYWLAGRLAGAGDLGSVGLSEVGHPLLGAGVGLGGERGWLFSGRLSVATHPWLVDHAVFDTVLLPGTAFVEMALAAGARAGLDRLDELVLEAPLLVPEHGGVQLQVLVGGPDEQDRCRVDVYSRPESIADRDGEQGQWVRHGSGVLSVGAGDSGAGFARLSGPWPPQGAEAVSVDSLYERLAEAGFQYGPAFQGVRAIWHRGEETFAEIALGGDQLDEAADFGVHPALFDAALHAALLGGQLPAGQVALPFAWNGVSLRSRGASVLRVALSLSDAGVGLYAVDESGAPVLGVELLAVRPVDAAQLAAGRAGQESLYVLDWTPVPAGEAVDASRVAVLEGGGALDLVSMVGAGVDRYPDVAALVEAIGAGGVVPEVVLSAVPVAAEGEPGGLAGAARAGLYHSFGVGAGRLTQPRVRVSRGWC